jgi:hypothetical protein
MIDAFQTLFALKTEGKRSISEHQLNHKMLQKLFRDGILPAGGCVLPSLPKGLFGLVEHLNFPPENQLAYFPPTKIYFDFMGKIYYKP